MISLERPNKCCKPGEYSCQIPIPIAGRRQDVDFCISDIVVALNAANITTIASCCGHGVINGSVVLEDGRELIIQKFKKEDDK